MKVEGLPMTKEAREGGDRTLGLWVGKRGQKVPIKHSLRRVTNRGKSMSN